MTAPREFDRRSVVVTGAASGMGRAIAVAFARAGASVVVADTDTVGGAATKDICMEAGASAIFQETDVSDEAQVAALIATAVHAFGRLDVMVNNAAVLGPRESIADQTEANLNLVLAVNVKGVVFGMKHALRAMLPNRAGVIVNMASVQGFRVLRRGAGFYAASKAAVISLTKSAALEYGPEGIRVVGLAPGPIDTPMLRGTPGSSWPPAIVAEVPLGRVGQSEEIAEAVLWLASARASYVSGAILPVDGGFLAP